MADNTIIQTGIFTSGGIPRTLVLRSDVDWVETINMTNAVSGAQNDSVKHYWQRLMPAGEAYIEFHGAANNILYGTTGLTLATPQFTLVDSSTATAGAAIAVTAGTNATQPVYSTANTGVLAAGAIVRVVNSAHTNLNGLDFSVDTVVANTSFRLANTIATAPGVVAGANGFWRYVAPDIETYKMFFPSNRVIANITQAAAAVVTTLVDHPYTTGQMVRMKVPAACGMTQMNDQLGMVTVLSASTFSITINSTGFTAFNFPLPAAVPYTPAEVIPVGEIPNQLGLLGDATQNVGLIGITLGAGVGSPAGVIGDVIVWKAGKSFNQ